MEKVSALFEVEQFINQERHQEMDASSQQLLGYPDHVDPESGEGKE
jgi:hypothetical protein